MKKSSGNIAPITAFILLLMSALNSAGQAKPVTNSLTPRSDSMTLWQARRTVVAGNPAWNVDPWGADRKSFRFAADNFEFEASRRAVSGEHFKVDLRKLEAVSIKCQSALFNKSNWCSLTNEVGKSLKYDGRGDQGSSWVLYYESWYDGGDYRFKYCSAQCISAANSFATAINRLRAFANDTESPLRNFSSRAAAWRATTPKPPLPEEVRMQRLLAEDAVKQKNPGEALNRYETGLELNPIWPEGWFNAALIAAELGYYADAAEHMQAYLELVPDAQDAQSARDQIAIWQYKAKAIR